MQRKVADMKRQGEGRSGGVVEASAEPRRCSSPVRSRTQPARPASCLVMATTRRPTHSSAPSPAWSTTPQTSMPKVNRSLSHHAGHRAAAPGGITEVERGRGDGDPHLASALLRVSEYLVPRALPQDRHDVPLETAFTDEPPDGACNDARSINSSKQGCLCEQGTGAAIAAAAMATRLRPRTAHPRAADGQCDPARSSTGPGRRWPAGSTSPSTRSARCEVNPQRKEVRSVSAAKTSLPPVLARTSCSSGLYSVAVLAGQFGDHQQDNTGRASLSRPAQPPGGRAPRRQDPRSSAESPHRGRGQLALSARQETARDRSMSGAQDAVARPEVIPRARPGSADRLRG